MCGALACLVKFMDKKARKFSIRILRRVFRAREVTLDGLFRRPPQAIQDEELNFLVSHEITYPA